MTERVVLEASPDMGPMLAGSLARGVVRKVSGRRPKTLPDRVVELTTGQDAGRLAMYDRVCGFGVRDHVPATWIHVLAFPLQMALLSAPDSPFALAGIVHVTNSMSLLRPVSVGERLRLTSSYGPPREHRRGVLIDMIGEAYVGDELVWRGVSAYLVRDATLPGMLPEDQPDGVHLPSDVEVDADAVWRLPANLGRQYSRVSGDYNPIHTSALGGQGVRLPAGDRPGDVDPRPGAGGPRTPPAGRVPHGRPLHEADPAALVGTVRGRAPRPHLDGRRPPQVRREVPPDRQRHPALTVRWLATGQALRTTGQALRTTGQASGACPVDICAGRRVLVVRP